MRFRALPVTDFTDITLDLEQLQTKGILDTTPSNFLQLLSAQKLQLAFGSGTFTFTASNYSAVVTITHNIGRVPQAVLALVQGAEAQPYLTAAPTSTAASLAAYYHASITGSYTFYWIAIG